MKVLFQIFYTLFALKLRIVKNFKPIQKMFSYFDPLSNLISLIFNSKNKYEVFKIPKPHQ